MNRKNLFLFLLPSVILFTLFLVSCGPAKASHEVRQMRIIRGLGQCALPDQSFEADLRIELLGPKSSGFWDGGKAPLVSGTEVEITPVDGSDLTITPHKVKSDVAGTVSFKVKAGKRTGDNYIKITPIGSEAAAEIVRFTVGAQISGGDQEGKAGETLAQPVSVKVVRTDGKPAAGVPVFFSIASVPDATDKTAAVLTPHALTNENGIAKTYVKLGKKTGEYLVGVEIADQKNKFFVRQSTVRVLGIDIFSIIMGVIGGLAFFMFGMKLMSDGLQKIAGENMKKLLQIFSANGIVAVLAGAVVTAVIQSSSATTVMVIGFINAGLLSLVQAIGIIFGANIGTTVTTQIISFNLSGLALPAIAAGLLIMTSKKRVVRGWGEGAAGFGLIFFGITMMGDEMKILGAFPTFVQMFSYMNCAPVEAGGMMPFLPMLGAILIGTVATCIIQSSAAAIGTVFVLSAAGLINFYTAVPILIGTNIGTTITAWIAAIPANRVAKQAALAHFLFNMIGAILMIILFYVPYGPDRVPVFLYLVNASTPGDAFAVIPQNIERHIAMAHTYFNVITVIVMVPFMAPFARLCAALIPAKDESQTATRHLEPLLLATPAVAIEQVIVELRSMIKLAWNMTDRSLNEHFRKENTDEAAFEKLMEEEQKVDDMQSDITHYLVQITRRPLTSQQSELIPILVHCTNDAERIGDHTETILKLTKRLVKTNSHLSDVAQADLEKIWKLLNTQADNVRMALAGDNGRSVMTALEDERKISKLTKKYEKSMTEDMAGVDATFFSKVQKNEEEINHLAKTVEMSHVERRNAGKCSVDASVIFIELLWELERIGNHLANIAVRAPAIQKHNVSLPKK